MTEQKLFMIEATNRCKVCESPFVADLVAEVRRLQAERDAYKKAKAENDDRFMGERDAALAERDAARQHIDRAWFGIEHGFDIEPREFFEKDAPRNGFKWPLEQAVHHIWKRDAKVASLQSALTEARRVLREVREWHRCQWKHGASVEVLDLTRHAEWIARIDAAVLAQDTDA